MYYSLFINFILGVEWFYNHPALRYGGYHIIALLSIYSNIYKTWIIKD